MSYHHALKKALEFSETIGDSSMVNEIKQKLPLIEQAIDKHWNGEYIWNTEIRKVDASVLHAIVSFSYFELNDPKVQKTIDYYN